MESKVQAAAEASGRRDARQRKAKEREESLLELLCERREGVRKLLHENRASRRLKARARRAQMVSPIFLAHNLQGEQTI